MDTETVKKHQQQMKDIEKLFEIRIDTEDLIFEIEKNPVIWDTRLDAYSDKIEKIKSWTVVLKRFIPEFDEKTEIEKNLLVTIAQKKWRSIRICYSRELQKKKNMKSGLDTVKKKQYIYFDLLRFLEALPKKTTNNVEEEDDSNSYPVDTNIEINPGKDENVTESKKHKHKRNRSKTENDEELFTVQRKKNCSEAESAEGSKEDEDRHFLLSLVSELRKVPSEKRLKLRCDIISVIAGAQAPDVQPWSSYGGPLVACPFHHTTQYHPSTSYQAQPPPVSPYPYPSVHLHAPSQQMDSSGYPPHPSRTKKSTLQQNSQCPSPTSSSLSAESIYGN